MTKAITLSDLADPNADALCVVADDIRVTYDGNHGLRVERVSDASVIFSGTVVAD